MDLAKSPRPWLRLGLVFVAASTAIAGAVACGPAATGIPGAATPAADAVRVVATTTVLADMVAQVGGHDVDVTSVVPKGAVVETFDPSPQDIANLADADLVVMNGLGLDEWLEPAIDSAASGVSVVRLAEDLPGVDYIAGDEDEGEGVNPHLWLDVSYAELYARRIADALAVADPTRQEAFRAGGDAYAGRLAALDGEIRGMMATIPEANRKLVSFHEAFPYFAQAYGLTIVGSVVGVPGQDPSAGEVGALVDAIRASGAKAVFTEAQFSPDLAEAIARDAGVIVESDLYNDSLGDPPVDTYERLIRWDVEKIVAALR